MTETNLRVLLAARPGGAATAEHFRIVEEPPPAPRPGEALLRHRFLSLDPYMRGRMNDAKSYAAPVAVGDVMEGQSVAQVVDDPTGRFRAGEWVLGGKGWQRFSAVPVHLLQPIDPDAAPPSAHLGVLGMPGTTAWAGVTEIATPKPGETFVVSAASGAVGSVAGQIARRMGARVVGIAGGAEKCAFVRDELRFDDCVDHRAPDFADRLAAALPNGVDSYFENVGGAVQAAIWPLLNDFARIAFCGMVAEYQGDTRPGPNLAAVIRKRLTLRGFIVYDFPRAAPTWRATGAAWLRDGTLRYREDLTRGLENAPDAFLGLLAGRNFGKAVVEVT